ncbi:molybdate transport system substrate-binding protein [Luteimonas sp. J16]|nr:molybdate transport system substrate-binding protein [Luteimonas sp. J16]
MPGRRAVAALRRRLRGLAAATALLLAACGGGERPAPGPEGPPPLVVFAAASLTESMEAAARAYTARSGQAVQVSFAGSPALARQIAQQAPADVFVSADTDWMDWLQQRGLVDPASRSGLLGNALVLVAHVDDPAPEVALAPGVDLSPLLGDDGRLAVALTASVPAGKHARAALESLGAWPSVQPRLAETENVRAALLLVARGEAPLGVVYATDAKAEPRVRVLGTFPPDSHPEIVYPVARVAASRHPMAGDFVQWLGSPEAAAIFLDHGFVLR